MNNQVASWISSLDSFSPEPDFGKDPFYGPARYEFGGKRGLLISGPSRNGNHLVHSLLDGHLNLPRIAGEDSTLNELFEDLVKEFSKVDEVLRSGNVGVYFRSLSGKGVEDK